MRRKCELVLFQGVELDPSDFFTLEMKKSWWCQHGKPDGAMFCPECGKGKPLDSLQKTWVNPKFRMVNPGTPLVVLDSTADISVVTYGDVILAGNQVLFFRVPGSPDGVDTYTDLPEPVAEETLVELCNQRGYKVLDGSYGLHIVNLDYMDRFRFPI